MTSIYLLGSKDISTANLKTEKETFENFSKVFNSKKQNRKTQFCSDTTKQLNKLNEILNFGIDDINLSDNQHKWINEIKKNAWLTYENSSIVYYTKFIHKGPQSLNEDGPFIKALNRDLKTLNRQTKYFSEGMIALIDCNNFYVSCERVFQPHLRKKPVVVLSN